MKKFTTVAAVLAIATGVAACGQTPAERIASGAVVGAGAAALGAWAYDANPGRAAIIGAGLGGLGGAMTPPGTFDAPYPYGY